MPTARPAASRRTALAAGGVVAAVTATSCGRDPGPGDAAARPASRPQAAQGDEAVLAAARADLAEVGRLVTGVQSQYRSLRGPLAELQRSHRVQLDVLDPEGRVRPARGPRVPGDPASALARVLREEERLQRRMVTWAVAVDSGPLARLLAAVAAGVAQQLAVLPRPGGRP